MTVILVSWENAHLYGEAWISHHRLRHQIFVGRQRWDIPTYNSIEYDQFDTPAAKYVLWLDEVNQARGVVRLLPTTRPYMIKTLWPQLLDGDPPETDAIWEVTRFGCDRALEPRIRRRVVAELICGCLEFGLANCITQYVTMTPVAVLHHVIMAAGCKVEVQSSNIRMGRHDVAVGRIEVSRSSFAEVRARAGIIEPVLGGVTRPRFASREQAGFESVAA
jgi:N-acyl-L-homoserine lactone synthetase